MSIFFAGNMVRQRHGIFNPPVASGYTWVSSQGLAWYNNVLAAGASITNANQAAFDTAFQSIYNSSLGNIAPAIQSSSFLMGFSDGSGGAGSAYRGCFVPIIGPSTVNNNFVASDFSRTAGLTGNGTTKYISSGINNDSTSSKHLFVYYTTLPSVGTMMIGSGVTAPNNCYISNSFILMNQISASLGSPQPAPSCLSVNRFNTTQYRKYSGSGGGGSPTLVGGVTSQTPNGSNIAVFGGGSSSLSNASLIFYSIGSSFSTASTELVTLAGIIETLRTSIT